MKVQLRPQVVVEPLYQRWFAWPHLIAPATAALNVRHRHLRIIDSFLAAPAVHERFARNPAMIGSPFMDLAADRRDAVEALREHTVRRFAHVLELADALAELDRLLADHARGYALDPLYAMIPDALRGFVELFYDRWNRPGFRLFESLLYRSRYYDTAAQSLVLRVEDRERRPFVLSTPRLPESGSVDLPIIFADPRLDVLFSTRTSARAFGELVEMFPEVDVPHFRQLFVEATGASASAPAPTELRIRYIGHACVLVESARLCIVVDPAISAHAGTDLPCLTFADLPPVIDYVLITHDHQDHVLLDTLLQLRHRIRCVIVPRGGSSLGDPSLRLLFRALGFADVIELDMLEQRELHDAVLTGVPFVGEHADLEVQSKLAYHLRIAGRSLLFAADSSAADPALHLHTRDAIGEVDVLFLGMECDGAPLSWLYGPVLAAALPRDMDASRRLAGSDCARALALVDAFRPREVYVYAMGQEPWLRHIMALDYSATSRPIAESDQLIAACRARGLRAERLYGAKELRHAA